MNAISRNLTSATTPTALTGWVLLSMGGLMLALPQKDIVTTVLTADLQSAPEASPETGMGSDRAIGWLKLEAQYSPVYCLDGHLAVVSTLIGAARVLLFRSDERILGLAGTHISLLANDADIVVPPLPACLKQPGSPLVGLALRNNAIVYVINAQMLGRYLSSLETEHAG